MTQSISGGDLLIGSATGESHSREEVHVALESGPRKLVRPQLPESSLRDRRQTRRRPVTLFAHQEPGLSVKGSTSSHAELFYFQKQIQAQTPMVFVLEDGERITGVIEWCDLHVIKVRHVTRTMIYKSSIKYLYKASDLPVREVMT